MKHLHHLLLLAAAALAPALTAQDFDHDGYDDLVTAVPFEDVAGVADAGAVHVLYGGAGGVSGIADQLITLQAGYYAGGMSAGDQFGTAVAYGDFNHDQYDDLAISAMGKDLSGVSDCGMVLVLHGSASGLSSASVWSLLTVGLEGSAHTRDRFGFSLAAADFNGDLYDDLAVGTPYADLGGAVDTGAVSVIYGSISGLSATNSQQLFQPGSNAEAGDLFGYSLAAGYFDYHGYVALAVGAPLEDVGSIVNAGAVWMAFGSSSGLAASAWEVWHQGTPGIQGGPETSDQFGISLACGRFQSTTYDSLVVGVPYEDIGSVQNAGCIQILHCDGYGLTDAGDQLFSQDTAGIANAAGTGDLFGFSLAVGDLNGDYEEDLVIGVPWEDALSFTGGLVDRAGAFAVIYNGGSALVTAGNQLLTQNVSLALESCEVSDGFGWAVTVGDFNGTGPHDLAVSAAYEDVGSLVDAGSLLVFYCNSSGVSTAGMQAWNQNSSGVLDSCESNDRLGAALLAH